MSQGRPMRRKGGGSLIPWPGPQGGAIELFTVVIVMVETCGVVPLGVTVAGEKLQVPGAGLPLQVRATGVVKLSEGVTVTIKVADCPCDTEAVAGLAIMLKSVPVPESAAVWQVSAVFDWQGTPPALSMTVKVPA